MSFTAALRDLNKLNTFVRVAQRRSFTKAAAELRTTPSVISKRMKELGEALGFSLVNRSTHGLVLTDAGGGLFQHCLELLAKVDDYVTERRNIEAGPFGTLRVQATSEYARFVLAPLTIKFAQERPGVRVHLRLVAQVVGGVVGVQLDRERERVVADVRLVAGPGSRYRRERAVRGGAHPRERPGEPGGGSVSDRGGNG